MTHPNGPARRALALAACALPALVLTACAPGAAPRAEGVRGTASDTRLHAAWQERPHARFYEQSIEWRPCTAEDGLDEVLTPSSTRAASAPPPSNAGARRRTWTGRLPQTKGRSASPSSASRRAEIPSAPPSSPTPAVLASAASSTRCS